MSAQNHIAPRARACACGGKGFSLTPPDTTCHHLRTIARELAHLRPDWRNPERYFENRNEIEHALRKLARMLEGTR